MNNICAYLFCVCKEPPQSVEASIYADIRVNNSKGLSISFFVFNID